MRELWNRQLGPYKGKVWAGIVAGGVGLGLLIRRFTRTRPESVMDEGVMVATTTPEFLAPGTQYNEGAIVAAVRDSFASDLGDIWETIAGRDIEKARVSPEVPADERPLPSLPGPAPPVPLPPGPIAYDSSFSFEAYRRAVVSTGHNPGTVVDLADIHAALNRIGHDPGFVINPRDLAVLWTHYGTTSIFAGTSPPVPSKKAGLVA